MYVFKIKTKLSYAPVVVYRTFILETHNQITH